MPDKPVALITGANQGIGRQVGKELAARNSKALVGSRDLARGLARGRTRSRRSARLVRSSST